MTITLIKPFWAYCPNCKNKWETLSIPPTCPECFDYHAFTKERKIKYKQEEKNMASLKETAKSYETPQTLNVADLEVVKTDLQLESRDFTDGEGKPFSIQVVNVEGKEYRVPTSVIRQLKAVLEEKPDLKTFKVTKSGEGLKTSYTIIPME